MTTVDLKSLELTEFIGKGNPMQHCRATFPLLGAHGTDKIASVYFELQPGDHLGRHTDSEEEILVILEGDVEVSVGQETGRIGAGQVAYVPRMVPHDLKNIGSTPVRVLGVFGGANNITATFDVEWDQMNTRVVQTAAMFE